MHENEKPYDWLLLKIDQFIAKYYANKLLKGVLILLGSALIYWLLLSISEYFLYFKSWIKIPALIIPSIVALYALKVYVAIPLLQMAKIGRRIDKHQAAELIGKHFPEIEDKLLNVLQLQNYRDSSSSRALLEASIEQKSRQLAPMHFAKAIDFAENKKWLPWALAPVIIAIVIFIFTPSIFKDSGYRLIRATQNFSKPAPFTFILQKDHLEATAQSDFLISLKLEGKQMPTTVNVILNGEKIAMLPKDDFEFQYLIKGIQENTKVQFEAAGYYSDIYTIQIIKKPILNIGEMTIHYPEYTNRPAETISGIVDMTVPQGSKITWHLKTENTTRAQMKLNDARILQFTKLKKDDFTHSVVALSNFNYTIYLGNDKLPTFDSLQYAIQVVKDQSPQIEIKQIKEKVAGAQILLIGNASDDYGLTKALFVYKVISNGNSRIQQSIPIPLTGKTVTSLQQYFDVATLRLQPGERLNYFIEVWDNDATNGYKSTRSQMFEYKMADVAQASKIIEENSAELNKAVSNSKSAIEEMQQQFSKSQKSSLKSQSKSAWEQQQNLESMQKQQELFRQNLEEIEKRLALQKQMLDKKQVNQQIQKQQEAIEKQLQNLKDNPLNKQMEKLMELMQKRQGEMDFNSLQQMQEQNKLFEMDMERLAEMIKKLESQIKLEDIANKLDQLAQKQQALNQKTSSETSQNDQLAKEQNQISKSLEDIQKQDMQELKNINPEQQLDDEEKMAQDAGNEMKKSEQQLKQNNNQKSKQSQSKAQEQLQQLASKMRQSAMGMDMKQLDINIKATRQLLTNLLRLSFNQEDLMFDVNTTLPTSQAFSKLVKTQYRLQKNGALIKDSLFALSKRVFELGPEINKESIALDKRLQEATNFMEERNVPGAIVQQQYTMTSANNLALMLNELLSNLLNMQMQMQGGAGGSQPMPSPGPGGQPSPGDMMQDIITGQKQMGKGLQQLGNIGNEGKQGQQGQGGNSENGQPSSGSSEADGKQAEMLSKMAYEQAKLRQQIQRLQSVLNSKGIKADPRILREIQQKMDRLETELINRNISDELRHQQQDIMTRLLQADQAIREQEKDAKRQSEQGQDKPRPIPAELQRIIDEQQQLKEFYRTAPPTLQPFYRNLSETYLNKINSI